jgi:RHS repeat-associated protein
VYTDPNHVHAVSAVNGVTQTYDANGNMTLRVVDGVTYTQTWDAENRLVQVSGDGHTTSYTYDGDGALVKKVAGGQTTIYAGNHYEKVLSPELETKYYYFNGSRVAMRKAGVLQYIAGDHLGTTSLVLNDNGTVHSEARHYPYGQERWHSGTLPTDYRFTGQRYDSYTQLTVMDARWYDAYINQFVSPDSIVPQPENPANFNRYAYCLGNPLRFIDPSGHDPLDAAWQQQFRDVHGYEPTWEDILIRLYSIAFPEEWSNGTWNALYTPDGQLRQGAVGRLFSTIPEGRDWTSMPEATAHMAGWYRQDETEAFIRDIGSLFGGLQNRFEQSNGWRAVRAGRAHNVSVFVGRAGLSTELLGSDATGNAHHWAWALNLGFFRGRAVGQAINVGREWNDAGRSKTAIETEPNAVADVGLGNIAVTTGSFMRRWPWSARPPQGFRDVWHQMPLTVSVQ